MDPHLGRRHDHLTDDQLRQAMGMLHDDAGLVVEPAAAAGIAAIMA